MTVCKESRTEKSDVEDEGSVHRYFSKQSISFFLLGILAAMPSMLITSAAKVMFDGITGVYGICLSVTAASASFVTPLFIHHISYQNRTLICTFLGVASYTISTLGSSRVGPAIGTMFAGASYAFSSNTYLALAAFFPQYTVVSFSIGCGLSVVISPALYIALMKALNQSWKRAFLLCIPFPLGFCVIWWALLDRRRCMQAEKVQRGDEEDRESSKLAISSESENAPQKPEKIGFGSYSSRIALFAKFVFPRYVVPLLCNTTSALFTLFGLAPTFQNLGLFEDAPKGNLQYEMYFLAYGLGQFTVSSISMRFKHTKIWTWAGLQLIIAIIGIIQLFRPFFKYYAVWWMFMFLVGGVVGGGITNTNYKIADDFRRSNEPEEVRSFAMSYGSLGNFGGDAFGGALAILVEVLATKQLAQAKVH